MIITTAAELISATTRYHDALIANGGHYNKSMSDIAKAANDAIDFVFLQCPVDNAEAFTDLPRTFTLPSGERVTLIDRVTCVDFTVAP